MSRSRAFRFAPITVTAFFLVIAGVLATYAGPARIGPAAGQETVGGEVPEVLPPIVRGAQTETADAQNALITLSFDDGSCEAGIGVGAPHTALVEFDAPTNCTQPGISIVQLTARVNTFTATAFTLRQSGATPGGVRSGTNVGMSNIAGLGPCPATGTVNMVFATRAVSPAPAVSGTANFFAGVNYGSIGGFIGRDTSSPSAMRQWLNCPTCGMTLYSPADISGLGLGGNFLIRVTVEACTIPVELIEFTVKSE